MNAMHLRNKTFSRASGESHDLGNLVVAIIHGAMCTNFAVSCPLVCFELRTRPSKDGFTHLVAIDGRTTRCTPQALLMFPTGAPCAEASPPKAPLVEHVQQTVRVRHETGSFAEWVPLVADLAKLTLISPNTPDTLQLQYGLDTRLFP